MIGKYVGIGLLMGALSFTWVGCTRLSAQQTSLPDLVDDASGSTATVMYCGSTARYHYFAFRFKTRLPDQFYRVPVDEVSAKGPWPRRLTNRSSKWVALTDGDLSRLIQDAEREPVEFPTVY